MAELCGIEYLAHEGLTACTRQKGHKGWPDGGHSSFVSPETNAHTADCLNQAANHLKEAIALLLCSNADDIEPDVDVLRPIAKRMEAKARP